MRSSVARSDALSSRAVWTKCQKSAVSPETGVPARVDSSLAMRNGDRALRPRSDRSSAIDATVDVKRDYTPHASRLTEAPPCGPEQEAVRPPPAPALQEHQPDDATRRSC